MKKTILFALSTALVTGAFAPVTVANETSTEENKVAKDEEQMQENFLKLMGTVLSLEKNENGLLYGVIEQQDNLFHIVVGEETIVVDHTGRPVELKEGMVFTAYVDGRKPMILIYPPQYSPDLVVVQTEEDGFVEVAQFDESFANETLKLNISDDTVIENLSGTAIEAKNMVGMDAAVFYRFTTFSIPAQTTPSKIIVLSYDEEEVAAVQTILKNDFYEVNGVKMVPLRLIAEKLGWTVTSTGKGAIVSKENVTFTITRGEKMYGYNRAINYFEEAPVLLERTKTYVPVEFVNYLLP